MTRTLSLLLFLTAACGPGGGPGAGRLTAGTVRGMIDYSGAIKGPLEVGLFSSFPPRGAPLAATHFDAPEWPQAYQVQGIPPGRYFVLAIVDADTRDGAHYHPSLDAGGAFGRYDAPLSLSTWAEEGSDEVDLLLSDPSSGSPWLRNGYR
jgi:hypothetical protein